MPGTWYKSAKGTPGMAKVKNIAIVAIVVAAAAAVMVLKQTKKQVDQGLPAEDATTPVMGTSVTEQAAQPAQGQALPRLVDLGAKSCIPCKMMAPILEELKKEYAETFKTEFVDVWQNPEPGRQYGIRVIPTQIFFDAESRELFRHEGYFG